MNPSTDPAGKPRVALLLATGFGLGYLPQAPGTWGSLGGVTLYWVVHRVGSRPYGYDILFRHIHCVVSPFHAALVLDAVLALFIALAGLWSAGRVEKHFGAKDPRFVVIDEISGQQLTYLLALAPANWKYLLLGLILFRGFDIRKPFPARRMESLPGGRGIMADDWIAAIYAAAGLWLARGLGW